MERTREKLKAIITPKLEELPLFAAAVTRTPIEVRAPAAASASRPARIVADGRRPVCHPGGFRNCVICEDCKIVLSKFPKSVNPEPVWSENEENGVKKYWCRACTDKLEEEYDRMHAARIAATLRNHARWRRFAS